MKIFKKFLAALAASVMAVSTVSISVYANNSDKVVDNACILSDTEEADLESQINEVIEKYDYSYDIVIHTTNRTFDKDIEAYSDDYYDYNDYGYDSEASGIIFVVDMGERYWHMGTTGKAITVFTDYGLKKIDDKVIGYLSDGDYYRCFSKFVELADDYINHYETTGEAYDVRRSSGSSNSAQERTTEEKIEVLFMSIFIGMIAALIVCLVMKAQLKSAKMQTNAMQYIRSGSFQVTNSREYFLYRTLTKTRIESNSGGGGGSHRSGGSTTHRSSSGRSHGGRSGRF